MSINAKTWEGGGAASVPDASETVKGKIRIATTAESTAGLDDLTAMTPAKVKARIDAALVGGVEYKGEYTGQSLVTALKGDMYISSGSQTLGGVSLSNGDHIIFNEDAANPVTSSMFDVIDNTETPASETVAGVIEIATNAEATAASATNKALVPSNISSIDLSSFDNDLSADDFAADHVASNYTPANSNIDGHLSGIDSALASVGGNQITLIDLKTTSFTAVSNAVYEIQSSLTVTMPGSPSEGDLIGFYAQGTATPSLTVSGTIETINNVQTTSTTIEVNKRNVVWWGYDGARWQQLNDSIKVGTVALAGVLETASNAEATAASATDKALTPSNVGFINVGDLNDDSTYQPLDAQLTDVAGLTPADGAFIVGDGANFVTESLATARTSLGLGTAATSDTGDFLASTAGLDDLSDVAYTAGAGINNYVLTYDHSTTSWGAEAGGIPAVVDDTTPQLGGALDVNGQAITSASNGDVTINPDGTGDISVGADIIPDADATHTLGSEGNRFITLHSELNGAVQFKARNETGGPLTKGQAVYISGVSGSVPLVSLARANSASTMPAHGLLAADVSNNADVQVISFGNLTAYNTTTHSLSLGDTVYVSAATAGALTSSAPAGETNLIQNIGKVVRASATEGIIKVGGAGRSAATPNLDNGKIFLGNASNQAVSTALSSAAVTSFNTQTGALTIGGDDLTADHTASNYTPANANIDGHLSGIDSALGAVGGGVDPTLTVLSNTTYTLSAANAPGVHIWYGASNSSTFTVTMPDIANVLSTAVSVNGDPGPTFEVYIGRGQAGDITVSAADGIDLLGDGSITYSTTQTVDSGQWVKLVGWYVSGSTQRYLMDSAAQPRDAGLTSISGLTTAADKMLYTTASDTYAVADLTAAGRAILDDADATAQRNTLGLGSAATQYVGTGANNVVQLDGSSRLPAVDGSQLTNLPSGGGWTYSAITADPANAQAGYHYSCVGTFTITLPTTGVSAGEEIRIKNMGTGTITLDPQTSNIDGSTTDYTMDIQYGALTLVSTGTHWEII